MTSLATSIPNKPNQPTSSFQFPKRTFGKTKIVSRSCQCSWFARWPFLHYDEANDALYCHMCVQAFKSNKMKTTSRADPAFVSYCIILCMLIVNVFRYLGYTWLYELEGC